MTTACLTLLYRAECRIWPWADAGEPGLLVEAFPAAQLETWGLPHQKYNDQKDAQHQTNREKIVLGLEQRIDLGEFRKQLVSNADALDAVVATFAGIAVTKGKLAVPPGSESGLEGWIAVHDATA